MPTPIVPEAAIGSSAAPIPSRRTDAISRSSVASPSMDPIIELISQWREAGPELAARSAADGETRNGGGDWLTDRMSQIPSAQTVKGAIAALEFALEECSPLKMPSCAASFVNAALLFLKAFPVPEERPATRAELHAYRAWLDMEGQLLGQELYPELGEDAGRFVLTSTGVRALHLPDDGSVPPKPSSRAVRVLSAAGANFAEIARRGAKIEELSPRARRSPSSSA